MRFTHRHICDSNIWIISNIAVIVRPTGNEHIAHLSSALPDCFLTDERDIVRKSRNR